MVRGDPRFYQAAERLGMDGEALSSYASQNPQYRALEQGLASFPGSQLELQQKEFIGELGTKADDLIERFGGEMDKARISTEFKEESLAAIDDIYVREGEAWEAIETIIPKTTEVIPSNTLAYIDQLAVEMGGLDKLPPVLRRLRKEFTTTSKIGISVERGAQKAYKPPLYGLLESRRKEIGQQLGRKGDTIFRTVEGGKLKRLYGALKEDQKKAIEEAGEKGAINLLNTADELTIMRKNIETNLQDLLGSKLQKDLIPVVSGALKQLSVGKTEAWSKAMDALPPEYRQRAVITAFNDIFTTGGLGNQALNPTEFTKFMDRLTRNKTAKRMLYRELPPEGRRALTDLYRVSKGVSTALQDKIKTGRISSFFDANNGMLSKLMNRGAAMTAAMAGGQAMGPMGAMAASSVTEEFLRQSSEPAKLAGKILADRKFQEMVRVASREGVVTGNLVTKRLDRLQKEFMKSKNYKDWVGTLPQYDVIRLGNLGLVSYLFTDGEE